LDWFDEHEIEHFTSKLYVGDYMNLDNPRVVVDRKHNLNEIANNLCQDHQRFAKELIRAKKAGVHVIILIEHGRGIRSIDDVVLWENPRLKVSKMAITGERLARIMWAMQDNKDKYDVEFLFCEPEETAFCITELLKTELRLG
jgi:ERCC4-type nuclease